MHVAPFVILSAAKDLIHAAPFVILSAAKDLILSRLIAGSEIARCFFVSFCGKYGKYS